MASSSTFTNLKSFTSIISKYGLSNLEKTLKCGNTTGGNNIVLSTGDSIKGQTQIVLTEAPAPSTSSTEGALFVSDGSSGNGNKNQLYYREAGNGIKLNKVSKPFKTLSIGADNFLKSGLCVKSHSLIFFSIHSDIGMYISKSEGANFKLTLDYFNQLSKVL